MVPFVEKMDSDLSVSEIEIYSYLFIAKRSLPLSGRMFFAIDYRFYVPVLVIDTLRSVELMSIIVFN